MLKQFVFIIAITFLPGACQSKTNTKDINTLLDNWHLAAINADLDSYFSAFDDDTIYLGTDASER
ncbi:MAG: hypothetical protein ACI93S_001434 [Ancylomarina sp.]|jgi:hypothetical protein